MRSIRGYIDQTAVYRLYIDINHVLTSSRATIVILLIHIIDKYKENFAGIKNICPML